MPLSARLSDMGSCNCPHGGSFVITSASSNVIVEGLQCARLGDSTTCVVCGQSGVIVSSSGDVLVNQQGSARKTDSTSGSCNLGLPCCGHGRSGTIQTSCSHTTING